MHGQGVLKQKRNGLTVEQRVTFWHGKQVESQTVPE